MWLTHPFGGNMESPPAHGGWEEEEEEGEEESLFKADAVNEEDSERDRATRRCPLCMLHVKLPERSRTRGLAEVVEVSSPRSCVASKQTCGRRSHRSV